MIKNEGYKESHTATVPFPSKGDWKDKSIFILSLMDKGTAADIAGKLTEYEPADNVAALEEHIEEALSDLVAAGKIKGELSGQVMIYGPVYPMAGDPASVPCGMQKPGAGRHSE